MGSDRPEQRDSRGTTRRTAFVLLVAIAGTVALVVILLGVGEPGRRSGLEGLFPESAVEDVEIDAATGLPIVPLSTSEAYWWIDAPDQPLEPGLRFASENPNASAVDPSERRVTIFAAFPDHAAAVSVAKALAAALGDPAAETAWLVEAGGTNGGGFEWLGSAAATAPFVQVVDRWLLLSDMAYREPFDRWEAASGAGPVYQSPLTRALVEVADSVLVEGDRSGEGSVAFDLSCRGDPSALRGLGQDLADHVLVAGLQPPWIAPGITADQRRARRTLRFLRQVQGAAFGRVLLEDPEFARLERALGTAADSGDAGRIREASADLTAYIERALPAELPALGPVAEVLDPDIVAAEVARYATLAAGPALAKAEPFVAPTAAERRASAAPFGASQAPISWRSGDAFFEVGLVDGELSLSFGSWLGVAQGLGPFVDYVAAAGCSDLDLVFHDYDDVRGD